MRKTHESTPSAFPTEDPRVARKRRREARTVSQMIAIHCAGNHDAAQRTQTAFCGEAVCAACRDIDDYAVERTKRCRRMSEKTDCEACENHCYAPAERERIRAIMRYAGPRMIAKHPIAAIRHLTGKLGR